MNTNVILAILCFLIFYFIFGKERDKEQKAKMEKFNQDSKDMLKFLLEKDHRGKLEKIVDRTKGDFHNIKELKNTYKLTTVDAKTLWESIKENK